MNGFLIRLSNVMAWVGFLALCLPAGVVLFFALAWPAVAVWHEVQPEPAVAYWSDGSYSGRIPKLVRESLTCDAFERTKYGPIKVEGMPDEEFFASRSKAPMKNAQAFSRYVANLRSAMILQLFINLSLIH